MKTVRKSIDVIVAAVLATTVAATLAAAAVSGWTKSTTSITNAAKAEGESRIGSMFGYELPLLW